MKEDFLHFLWKNRLFEPINAITAEGDKVEIVNSGRHNIHSGPDFFDARIKIGQTLWAGNVEIHLKASDWNRHGHHKDPLYRNTILHVVAENDFQVKNDTGSAIPTLEIGWPLWIEYNYRALMQQHDWVNCASQLNRIDPFRIRFFLNGIAIERLQQKITTIETLLERSKGDWSETFYWLLLRSFGFRQNGDPFEILARSLPFSLLQRHHESQFQLESLLFGQAGLLQESLHFEEYPQAMVNEYKFLSSKYKLKPMSGHLWKFMRMHPLNFPTIRLAQLAGILHQSESLFSAILQPQGVDEFRTLFKSGTTPFWDTHYTFLKSSKVLKKGMGEESFQLILVNVVVPFLFLYGERNDRQELKDRALRIMEELPAENNTIVRHWNSAGIRAINALESQSLIHLHHMYCEPKRCLECSIGQKLIIHAG
ncbi:MAG: DUF2851 family protein [Prolixibacteraceae bacterium]